MARGLDIDAFEVLYRESADDVYAFIAGMVRERDMAEEVTAEAFEKALRRRSTFDASRGSARGWLFGIARNAALDELRRRKRVQPTDEPPEPEARPGSRDDADELRAERLTIRAGLARLTDRDRELVALKFYADLSHAEIGEAMGVSESNAGTMLHRAMVRLREVCADAA